MLPLFVATIDSSVMLGMSMAGEFLPPFVIFAGIEGSQYGRVSCEIEKATENGYSKGMHYAVQKLTSFHVVTPPNCKSWM